MLIDFLNFVCFSFKLNIIFGADAAITSTLEMQRNLAKIQQSFTSALPQTPGMTKGLWDLATSGKTAISALSDITF